MEGYHVRRKASSSTSSTGFAFHLTVPSRLKTEIGLDQQGHSSHGISNRIKDICISLGLSAFQSHKFPGSAHILEYESDMIGF